MSRMLNTNEAAQFLGLAVETLEGWRTRRKGPDFFKVGGLVKYKECDLVAWLERQRVRCEVRHGS